MNRRDFLKLLGLGATATAAGLVLPELEPVRRYWAVPRNAPVPSRATYTLQVEGWPTDFRSDNTGEMLLRDAADPYRAVFTYEAAERIQPGALVALGPDGKVRMARSASDAQAPIIGMATRFEWQFGGGQNRMVVDVPAQRLWTVTA